MHVQVAVFCLSVALPAATRQPEREVDAGRFQAVLRSADRVTVVEETYGQGSPKVLSDSTEPAVLAALASALQVVPADGRCACMPSLSIRLHREGRELLSVGYLGDRLHASLWDGDAQLVDHEKLLAWFDAQGVTGPRQDEVARREDARRNVAAERRWVEAMPRSLRPLWDENRAVIVGQAEEPDLDPWRAALEREFPAKLDRIAALLAWFGSGDGPWSGYPSYEGMAETLLLDFETAELVRAIQEAGTDEARMEGGARLLAGWDFGRQRPRDLLVVPPALKKALLTHSLRSTDEDKRARARSAFR